MSSDRYQRTYYNDNQEFDLDAYIEERSNGVNEQEIYQDTPNVRATTSRNLAAIFIFFVLPAIFLLGWNPFSVFSSPDDVLIRSTAPVVGSLNIPSPSSSPSELIASNLGSDYLTYLEQLREIGLGDEFSSSATQALFSSGVPIEYIDQLNEMGFIDNFSFPAIIAIYNSDVPIDYVQLMDEAGILDEYSFPAVIAFYNAEVSTDYIRQLSEMGITEEYSFPGLVAFNGAGVTPEYLQQLSDIDLISEFSFPAVTALYGAGVPVSYLEDLSSRDLIDDLSFPEIIQAYNLDNN